jgi:hypothetical protein
MFAFIKVKHDLYKIYDQGDDWQIIGPRGFERWVSQYANLPMESLRNAISRIPDADVNDLVICS